MAGGRRYEPFPVRVQRLLPPDDPLLPALAAAIGLDRSAGYRYRSVRSYLGFLADRGVGLREATPALTEAWASTSPTGHSRAKRLAPLRQVTRALVGSGTLPLDPSAGVPLMGPRRADRRLAAAEVERVVGPVRTRAANGDLTASRDMVVFALLMWRGMRAADLPQMRWGDLDRGPGLLHVAAEPEPIAVPACVLTWIELLEARLLAAGVVVDPDDALLPALGNRVAYDWMGDERSLLAPVSAAGVHLLLCHHVRRSGIDRRSPSGSPFLSPLAFHRQPEELEAALAGQGGTRRVAMRRPVQPVGSVVGSIIAEGAQAA